ncbi:MAG: hypothetical protein KGD57_04600 [Candidatus Lokiarchaeota archaeon]|nr:hypothetical protein [Candidatus Lokiarchaeota archaeon]
MTDSHIYSFFGKETAIILQTSSKNKPYIFLRCIKKNKNDIWEKWSKNEGKAIKFSIEEIIMILRVLHGKQPSWSTYHRFNEKQTQISFNMQNNEQLFISIDKYKKMLSIAQIEVLKLLLEHILKEKIEFATKFEVNHKEKSEKIQINNDSIYIEEEVIP